MRKLERRTKFRAQKDDILLRKILQRRLDGDVLSLDSRGRRRVIRQRLELDEFRAAVRVARIIDGIDADVDMRCAEHFRIAHRIRKENQVAGRHVRRRHRRAVDIALRHLDVLICQCRTSNGLHVRLDDQMFLDTVKGGYLLRALKFNAVTLVIIETDGIYLISLGLGDCHARATVKASRK